MPRPLYPLKRTTSGTSLMSAMGHLQTLPASQVLDKPLNKADASLRALGDGLPLRIRSLAWNDELHGIDPLGGS